MSSFAQRPNRSAWPAIVPKTARFAWCHCSFYRFAFHKFPLCLILLWIHARGSSAKRSRGRCKTQLFNRSSRRKKCRGARSSALANLGLMEPARCGRRAKKWIAGLARFFHSATRAYRSGWPRSMVSNAVTPLDNAHVTMLDFLPVHRKTLPPTVHFS